MPDDDEINRQEAPSMDASDYLTITEELPKKR